MSYLEQIQRTVSLSSAQHNNHPPSRQGVALPNQSNEVAELKEMLLSQKNHFERLAQISKNQLHQLEKEVYELKSKFEKSQEFINKIKDKEVVTQAREAMSNRRDSVPSDRPIDRNNVAPADVQISKIFNCAGKKF